jgi:hypothetical protein
MISSKKLREGSDMDKSGKLDKEDRLILRAVLNSKAFQLLIGAEEWDLTEREEMRLWGIKITGLIEIMEAEMDERTLTALEGSIAKWAAIVGGTGEDNGVDNCPLCDLFINGDDDDSDCEGCPVALKVKERGCYGTPYTDWASHQRKGYEMMPWKAATLYEKGLARAELEFLKSLRPQE